MKVVDIVARIPKHLDLYFSDFSTILFRIYKFAGFENKRKKNANLHLGPWKFVSSQRGSLADIGEQRRVGRPFSGEERLRRWGKSSGKGRGD